MVGIAPQFTMRSSWISFITCSGSKRPSLKTSFAPAVSPVHRLEWSPPTWKSGEVSRFAGWPAVSAPASVAKKIPVTCAIVPRWVVMQPFERPVVPDV
jgi:hypothetical protein